MWHRDTPSTLEEIENIKGEATKEYWKYLIGSICLSEKNKCGDLECVRGVYERIERVFGYVRPSLRRIVDYAKAIDRIQRLLPDIATDILNGKLRISAQDTIRLAKMGFPEICNIIERLTREKTPATVIFHEQNALRESPERRGRPKRTIDKVPCATVKDMPPHDPDAQINALTYTIPSWVSMIERAFTVSNFDEVSPNAQIRLAKELRGLAATAETVTALITEGING
jgi:hypothetical protein